MVNTAFAGSFLLVAIANGLSFEHCIAANDYNLAMMLGSKWEAGKHPGGNLHASDTDYLLGSYLEMRKSSTISDGLGPINANRLAGRIDGVMRCETPKWWIEQLSKRVIDKLKRDLKHYNNYYFISTGCRIANDKLLARDGDLEIDATVAFQAIAKESQIQSGFVAIKACGKRLYVAMGIDEKINYHLYCYDLAGDCIRWKSRVWGYSNIMELGPRIPKIEIVCGPGNVTVFGDRLSALYCENFSVDSGRPIAKFNSKLWAVSPNIFK